MLFYDILAQAFGVIASITVVLCFQIKNPRRLVIVNIGAMFFFTLHFGMLGGLAGMIQNALGVVRNLLILAIPAKTRANRIAEAGILIAFALVPVAELLIPAMEFSWWDLLPTVAMVLGSLLYWTADAKKIRIAQLCIISPCWLTYDVISSSVPGIVTEIFNITSVLVSFVRFWLKKKNVS